MTAPATVLLRCVSGNYRNFVHERMRGEPDSVGRWNHLEATNFDETQLLVVIPDYRGPDDLRILRCTEGVTDVELVPTHQVTSSA